MDLPAAPVRAPELGCKTFVLVHGGHHGAWCWKKVAGLLRAQGHAVYTPTLTGLGERSHLLAFKPTLQTWIEDVAQVLRFEELEDVILVGHSFAGSIVSALADRMPERLRHLVYLDAQLLESGESSSSRVPERAEFYRQRAIEIDGCLSIPALDPVFFGITEPGMARWISGKLVPHPLQTYYDELELIHPLGNGLPATYIACSQPLFGPTEGARALARRMDGWTYLEIPTAHDAMLLMPEELTELLSGIG